MTDNAMLSTMVEIRNWVRAAAYPNVKRLLEEALPDSKSRRAYQMADGKSSRDSICKAIKLGKSTFQSLQQKCVALGLMAESDGKRYRLFDLQDFGLLDAGEQSANDGETDGKNGRSGKH